MAFDRDAAIKYAEKYWNIPCDDGVFWLTNEAILIAKKRTELKAPAADGWEPMFVKGDGGDPEKAVFRRTVGGVIEEKLIAGWDGLADCAHYLSRCLSAGGAATNERGVQSLVNTLQDRSDTKTLCEKVPKDRAQQVIDSGVFKKGDMVGYFNTKKDGDYNRIGYTHSTMYVGKLDAAGIGGVTCHTVARFPPLSWVHDSWWLHDGYTYTLIHFSSDDTVPPPGTTTKIEGWWKLEYSGRTEYYYVFKDGRARYTKRAPKTAKDNPNAAMDGSAYWFIDGAGKITFIWKSTGTVEVWTPAAGTAKYSSMINGSQPGVLTKI